MLEVVFWLIKIPTSENWLQSKRGGIYSCMHSPSPKGRRSSSEGSSPSPHPPRLYRNRLFIKDFFYRFKLSFSMISCCVQTVPLHPVLALHVLGPRPGLVKPGFVALCSVQCSVQLHCTALYTVGSVQCSIKLHCTALHYTQWPRRLWLWAQLNSRGSTLKSWKYQRRKVGSFAGVGGRFWGEVFGYLSWGGRRGKSLWPPLDVRKAQWEVAVHQGKAEKRRKARIGLYCNSLRVSFTLHFWRVAGPGANQCKNSKSALKELWQSV